MGPRVTNEHTPALALRSKGILELIAQSHVFGPRLISPIVDRDRYAERALTVRTPHTTNNPMVQVTRKNSI